MENNILIDAERTRYISGISVVCRNLIRGLSRIKANNLNIYVYARPKDFSNNIKFHFRKFHFWHRYINLNTSEFSIVHVMHQANPFFRRKVMGTKIITLHDLNFLHEKHSSNKKNKMLKKVKSTLKYADVIVCISEFTKTDFLNNKHLFDLKKLKEIVVIHNGIELPEQKNYSLGNYSFLKEKNYLLNIGVLFSKKNQLSIIEMLPFCDFDLVLLASSEKEPYATEVRKRISELNLQHRVHFLKNLTEDEKYGLIQHCTAMVHPSLAEGFGIPPIEAMAFGKPVFLSTYTSLPEIGGEIAFYFPSLLPKEMADFITVKLADFNGDRSGNELKSKQWAANFDYMNMATQYAKLYMRILKNQT